MARLRNESGIIPTQSARSLAAKKRWREAQKGQQSAGNRASQRQIPQGTVLQLQAGCTYGFGRHTIMTLPNGQVQFV